MLLRLHRYVSDGFVDTCTFDCMIATVYTESLRYIYFFGDIAKT